MANRGTRYDDAFRAASVALVIEQKLPISLPAKQLVVSEGGATQLSNNVIFVFKKDAAASGGFKVLTGMLK